MNILAKLWRHGEGVLFWMLALAHLVPVWAFPYLATQDGPSHLVNALILKDHGSSAGYAAYFEVRLDPVPNWTSHLLLAGLMYVASPLSAEKLLVSLYVLGFAGSYRYFLGGFGDRGRAISWFGLLFIFNRCFWMGFYNFCLSLIVLWLIVGYCVRRRGELRWPQCGVLAFLFALAYFTHLAGFILALVGALGAALLVRPRRQLAPVFIALAAAPSCCLAMDYFDQTGFFEQGAGRSLIRQPLALLDGGKLERSVTDQVIAMDQELFEHHAGNHFSFGLVVVLVCAVYVAVGAAEHGYHTWLEPPLEATEVIESGSGDDDPAEPTARPAAGRLFPLVMALLTLAFYVLSANDLGAAAGLLPHGGYLKARLAIVPPLFLLACLREPMHLLPRLPLRCLTMTVVMINLVLVTHTMAEWNRVLEQYTAGIGAVGRGHRLMALQGPGAGRLANPLVHAADYYCLGTGNINLDNYEARTTHFPVKYRPGVPRDRSRDADTVIYWRIGAAARPGWDEIFAQGVLRICRKRQVQPLETVQP